MLILVWGLQVENFLRDSGVVVSCDICPRLKSGHREPLTRRVLAGHFHDLCANPSKADMNFFYTHMRLR